MALLHTRIRSLRRRQNRTLKDIADRCGFTVSLLSKIESGKTNPPVATLTKIALALGVSVADFLQEEKSGGTVVTTAKGLGARAMSKTDKGYAFHLLAAERPDKLMQPFLFEARKGKIRPGPMNHGGEEFVHVLEGRMRYRVADVTYDLGPGDSLYFDAENDHDLTPLTAKVRYLALFAERLTSPDRVGDNPHSTKLNAKKMN